MTTGIVPCALRASLRLFKLAPGDLVAPNARNRPLIVKARTPHRGAKDADEAEPTTRAPSRWMARLKQVFDVEVSVCARCAGQLRVIGEVTEPNVIATILEHLRRRDGAQAARAPPTLTRAS